MADTNRPLPPKKEVALLLLNGPSVFLHLDPRKKGVIVPKHFLKQPQLVLQVGLNMPVPIRDLEVTDDALTCTLSFARTPFWCSLPWTAVYALVGEDGRGMVWPEDVPPEVAAQSAAPPAAEQAPKPKPRRSRAKARKDDDAPESAAPATRSSKKESGRVVALRPAPAAAPAPEPESAPVPAAPRPAARPGAPKKKRELPPYLRVIK